MYKFLNPKEGYQNNNHIYSSDYFGKKQDNTEYSFIEVEETCSKNGRQWLYDTSIPNIKKDIVKRQLLKKYIDRLERGEKVCWNVRNYLECKRIQILEKETPNNLTEQDKEMLNNVCESEMNCIEENMKKKYNDELNSSDLNTLIKKAQDLSIDTTEKDKKTLIKEIIDKKILSSLLKELTLLNDIEKDSIDKLDETENLIIKTKIQMCEKVKPAQRGGCGLDKHACDDIRNTTVSNTFNPKELSSSSSRSSSSRSSSSSSNNNSDKNKNIGLIIGATIGGIVLIAIIIFLVKKYKKK